MVDITKRLVQLNREIVNTDYKCASVRYQEMILSGLAINTYILPNQIEDSMKIMDIFYNQKTIRVMSICNTTKNDIDGLMIEVGKNFSTHQDDNFMIHRDNILIISGSGNIFWENDMKNKIPDCFKNNVFQHGKLNNLKEKLETLNNSVIIMNSCNIGKRLEKLLKDSGLLHANTMIERNIRLISGSGKLLDELQKHYKWQDNFTSFVM